MKFLYVVHTTRNHPTHAWVFASETKAKRLLNTLQNGGGHQDAVLIKAPLNPNASSHLRTTITFDWQGRMLSATTPVPFPTIPPEPFLTIYPFRRISAGEPWITCRLETSKGAKALRQASEKAAQTIDSIKSMGLWPATEEEAQAISEYTLQNFGTPAWIEHPPTNPTHDDGPPGLLSDLIICRACNAVLTHQQTGDDRYYLCPGPPSGQCPNPMTNTQTLDATVAYRVIRHLQQTHTILDLALKAELPGPSQDQRALNAQLAAHAIESAKEILETVKHVDPESDTMLNLAEYTATLITHLQQAAADGSSTAETIARTSFPHNPHTEATLHRHTKHCMINNPTQANRRTVSDLIRLIDPTPDRETITWRLPPKGRSSIIQKVDENTFMREIDDELSSC